MHYGMMLKVCFTLILSFYNYASTFELNNGMRVHESYGDSVKQFITKVQKGNALLCLYELFGPRMSIFLIRSAAFTCSLRNMLSVCTGTEGKHVCHDINIVNLEMPSM